MVKNLHFWALTSFLTVIVGSIKLGIVVGQLHAGDHQVVLFIWGVGAQHQPVDAEIFAFRSAGERNETKFLPCEHGEVLAQFLWKCPRTSLEHLKVSCPKPAWNSQPKSLTAQPWICCLFCFKKRAGGFLYLVTSGSHWAVRLGHSRAWVITKSYRKGVFFFHILYSSLITRSSTASSKAAGVVFSRNTYN